MAAETNKAAQATEAAAAPRPLILHVMPQITSPVTTQVIMRNVLIALVPSLVAAVAFFGLDALIVCAVSVIACVGFEWLWCRLRKVESTVDDLSAAVTGLLLAFNVPSTMPLYMVVIGAFVAIVITKELFGGIGFNFANPAIVGRIFLAIAFPVAMTSFVAPQLTLSPVDVVSTATPLSPSAGQLPLLDLFLGAHMGVLGETSALAILIGLAWLLWTRTITWHMPVTYVGIVFVLSALMGLNPVAQVCSGGLLLGAVFMLTDYSTSPSTLRGKLVYAAGAALIVCLIRFWGNLNEGVAFSILFMNLLVPHIDAVFVNTPVGGEAIKRAAKEKGGKD